MITTAPDDLLSRGSRCFLATAGDRGPQVTPMSYWSDGQALWMTAAAATIPALAEARERDCAAYVPPVEGHGPGAVVHGRARVHSVHDPFGLVLRTATISAAMAALAARNAAALLGSVGELARAPAQWLFRDRFVVRLVVHRLTEVDPPDIGPGVAPALPTVVPADVRRALAGRRRIVLVWEHGDTVAVTPAVWEAGYALRTPPTLQPTAGAAATAVVDVEDHHDRGRPVGLALHGAIEADRFVPRRATSWYGRETDSADVARPVPGGVVLPD